MGVLPEKIVIYRDGVGGPSFMSKVLECELGEMISAMENYEKDYKPKILYIFVDKRINTRFFE
jgi:aubergine